MDYHDDIEEFGDKLHNGAVFICQLIRAGSKNAAKTHRILKAGITILFVALVLYLIGFISPYWVVGDNHAHTHHGTGNGTRAFHLSDFHRNDTHFGLWQECVVFDGRSFCTLFTDDIDSVIIMFGCVGAFILFSLCCWACVSCIRKPRKHRYLVIVVAAIIGGIFGFVAIFIFISVEGNKPYSWAFGLFLISCTMELCAAPVILWGIARAMAGGAFPQVTEEAEGDPTTTSTIVLHGPTPTKESRKRSVHVLKLQAQGRKIRFHSSGGEDDHVDFVTLDMVSRLPDQTSREGRRGVQGRRGKKKNRARKSGSRSGGGRERKREGQTPVEALARTVAEQQLSFVSASEHEPLPQPRPDKKPTASVTDRTLEETSAKHPAEEAASVHVDPTAPSLQEPPTKASVSGDASLAVSSSKRQEPKPDAPRKEGRPEETDKAPRRRKKSRGPRRSEPREHPANHDWIPSASPFSPKLHAIRAQPHRLQVDVHRPFAFTEALEASDNPEEERPAPTKALGSRRKSSRGEELRSLPSAQTDWTAAPAGRRSEAVPLPDTEGVIGGTILLTPCNRSGRMDQCQESSVRRSGCSNEVERKEEGDDSEYIRYSPDTYYRSRSSF